MRMRDFVGKKGLIVALGLMIVAPLTVRGATYVWKTAPSSGQWDLATNWSPIFPAPPGFPDAVGDVALFPTSSVNSLTSTQDITVGEIDFGGSTPYSFAPPHYLFLDNGASQAIIGEEGGSKTVVINSTLSAGLSTGSKKGLVIDMEGTNSNLTLFGVVDLTNATNPDPGKYSLDIQQSATNTLAIYDIAGNTTGPVNTTINVQRTAGAGKVFLLGTCNNLIASITIQGADLILDGPGALPYCSINFLGSNPAFFDISECNDAQSITGLNGTNPNATVALGSQNLFVESSVPNSYAGKISGGGTFSYYGNQLGNPLVLSGDNSGFRGDLTVKNGTLLINNNLNTATGSVLVGVSFTHQAVLGGTGPISAPHAVFVNNHGTIAPSGGSSAITTMNVIGNVNFNNGSTYFVNVSNSPQKADLLVVTGGNIKLNEGNTTLINVLSGTTFPIIDQPIMETSNGGTITGYVNPTFPVIGLYAKLKVNDQENPTQLLLSVQPYPFTRGATYFAGNAEQVNEYLVTQLYFGTASPELVDVSRLINSALLYSTKVEDYNALAPSQFNAFSITEESITHVIRSAIQDRLYEIPLYTLACCECPNPCGGIFVTGLGDYLNQNETQTPGSPFFGYQSSTNGFLVGCDAAFGRKFAIGGTFGYTNSTIDWKNSLNRGKIDSFFAGVYASSYLCNILFDGSFIASSNKCNGNREIAFLDYIASHENRSYLWDVHLGATYPFYYQMITLAPFAMVDFNNINENGYEEEGAGDVSLIVDKRNANLLRAEEGVRFFGCFSLENCCDLFSTSLNIAKVIPSLSFSFIEEMRFAGDFITSRMLGAQGTFVVDTYNPNRLLLAPAAEIELLGCDNHLGLSLRYEGEFGAHVFDQNITGKLSYNF